MTEKDGKVKKSIKVGEYQFNRTKSGSASFSSVGGTLHWNDLILRNKLDGVRFDVVFIPKFLRRKTHD